MENMILMTINLVFVLLIPILFLKWKTIRRHLIVFPREMRGLFKLMSSKLYVMDCKRNNKTVPKIFKEISNKYPNRVMFYFKDEVWTFRQIDELSNKVANAFTQMGYQTGDEVALFMNNRPEFVALWLGLAKARLITAWINTSQRQEVLIHSISVVNCKAIIFDKDLAHCMGEVSSNILDLRPSMKFFGFGDSKINPNFSFEDLNEVLSHSSSADPINLMNGSLNDKLYYVFTSGTTGLPKAAVVRNHRYIFMGNCFKRTFDIRLDDNLYVTLPLYHTNAGLLASAQALLFGTTLTLRERFSASNFWNDCIRYKCSSAIYIGELCRYLLAQPEKPEEKEHRLRNMCGNGLRKELWTQFKNRFKIKDIGEFYGSSEGTSYSTNFTNREGSCGFIPLWFPSISKNIYPMVVIKVDPRSGQPIRDENGLCQSIKSGEVGEIVGKIIDADPTRASFGYSRVEENDKKIIRDVLKPGDMAFSSGDLLEMDELGYLYFRDRIGDNFRWKGENVSTTEVEAIIQKVIGFEDCIVFGVKIECCEGKAGMAVIANTNNNPLNLKELYSKLKKELTSYAMPVFVRFAESIETTTTFKLTKHKLERDGFNPELISDKLYFLDRNGETFTSLTLELYKQIQSGRLSF